MDYSNIYNDKYTTLLLDRDGIINVHIIGGYVCKKEDFEFIPGVLEEMSKMAVKFKYIFIVTNQRGVGKGLLSEDDLDDIHQYMIKEIVKIEKKISDIFIFYKKNL